MQQKYTFCLMLLTLCLSCVHVQPAYVKWAELVEHVPTAVSHQSSTVVHSSVAQRTPLLAAPAVRSFVIPSLNPAAAYVHAHAAAHSGWRYLYSIPSAFY